MVQYYDAQSQNNSKRSGRIYTDLDLFFGKKSSDSDINVVNDIQAVKRSVRNLVLLNAYEKPFHPEIGASITDSLFEPVDVFSMNIIQQRITDSLENYEPRIIIENITVRAGESKDFLGDRSNEIIVNLEFYIKNVVTDLIEYETIIKRVR